MQNSRGMRAPGLTDFVRWKARGAWGSAVDWVAVDARGSGLDEGVLEGELKKDDAPFVGDDERLAVWLLTIPHGPAHDLSRRLDRVVPRGLEITVVGALVVGGDGGPRFHAKRRGLGSGSPQHRKMLVFFCTPMGREVLAQVPRDCIDVGRTPHEFWADDARRMRAHELTDIE